MKNKNKYLNLISGMTFLAINSSGIVFAALATYGLMMIRDFTIKHVDNKLKMQTETLLAFNLVRAVVGLLGAYAQVPSLSYILISLNVIVFILTFMVLGNSVRHLSVKLNEFELSNSINKIHESFYIIIAADAVLIVLLLLVILTLFYPIPIVLNVVSLFLNQNINMIISIGITLVKYLASRSFTRAGSLLMNAIMFESGPNNQ